MIDDSILSLLRACGAKRIVCAFSGGPDSVALLHALASACPAAGIGLSAVHCNFHLRGEESDRDARFAADFCRRLGIPLDTADFDTCSYCREKGISTEMGARKLRHDLFRRLCDKYGALLATGHNADDNAETLLLNMLRGSGVKGLRGMLPFDGHIIRPLLRYSRKEILEYLRNHRLDYVTDSTNLESEYRRNYLRNKILPLLREKWHGADRAIARTLSCLADDDAVVEQSLAKALYGVTSQLPWQRIRDFAAPRLLILRFIAPYGGDTEIAEEIAAQLPAPRIGARWFIKDKAGISWRIAAASEGLEVVPEVTDKIISREDIADDNASCRYICMDITISDETDLKEIKRLPLTSCCLPGNREDYIWLPPENGMRIAPLGMKGTTHVRDAIRDARLSAADRAQIRVLCRRSDREPVWIPGVKRSRHNLIKDLPASAIIITMPDR